MDGKEQGKRNIAGAVATFGTAVLAITALITVFITISSWKEDREANRPYFTFKEAPQVLAEDDLEFQMIFTNVGEHPAVDLWSRALVLDGALVQTQPLVVEEYALVNDIPQNASATLVINLENIKKYLQGDNVEPHFIVIALRYQDSIIDKEFDQTLYIKWNGLENGESLSTTHGSEEEKAQIEAYLKKNNIFLQ